jgi:hypothetical protein
MSRAADESLPEVFSSPAPQALSRQETAFHQGQLGDPNAKFPVYVEDAPEYRSPPVTPWTASTANTVPWETRFGAASFPDGGKEAAVHHHGNQRTICGLRRRIFWLLLGAVLVIVAASVGGGVGGAMAAARSSSAPLSRQVPSSIVAPSFA